ncbi:antibiotic biosynthesis monooxygenase family protein [Streptoverticillium reticulum]|uniref:antibiotic biosynthesis monooxygenase family protein n=1 Tax=Streptoverticillium reticulum TaxID=1433415 RepID=UPI0039BF7D6E
MTGEVRVLVYHTARGAEAVESAYHEVSRQLAGVPGMLGNELLHDVHDTEGFVVVSKWQDLAAFERWERGEGHRDSTAALRPYRDHRRGRPFAVYRVTAAY